MAALLRRRRSVHTFAVRLGETPLTELADHVRRALLDRHVDVVLDVVDFEYFDENTLTALTDLAGSDDRITLRGLDHYGESLLSPTQAVVDVRTTAERALTHLAAVTVVTAVVDDSRLDDASWDEALTLSLEARRPLVTLDLRGVPVLSAHQTLSLAEFSADLFHELRMLIIVNASTHVAAQLRVAGLHGRLLMRTDATS